jgi:DIS3-like exonuclease 2
LPPSTYSDLLLSSPSLYVSGRFRALGSTRRGGFVSPSDGLGDVYIDGDRNRNRAMDGDEVVVKIEAHSINRGEADAADDGDADVSDADVSDADVSDAVSNLKLEDSSDDEAASSEAPSSEAPSSTAPQATTWSADPVQAALWAPQHETPRVLTLPSASSRGAPTQRRGLVVAIVSHPNPSLRVVGMIKPNHNNKPNQYLLHPVSQKLPLFNVACLPSPFSPSALYSATYTHSLPSSSLPSSNTPAWTANKYYPPLDANSLTLIGESLDVESETIALLAENDISHGELFDPKVVADVQSAVQSGVTTENNARQWCPTADMLAGRRDFRKTRVCTIDPTTAKDLDDALHILPLPNNEGVEVGVHIADVGHFITPDTAVDREAEYRATTVYLVDRTIPMLPRDLCEIACSLNEDVDRLAFSCVFQMNYDGTMKTDANGNNHVWYGKSVIRSCARLDYATAQNIIENQCDNPNPDSIPEDTWPASRRPSPSSGFSCADVAEGVKLMHSVAMNRRKKRFANGALALNRTKVVFRMDKETNEPYQAEAYPIKDSNRLVEEYMLLANYLVAERLITHGKGKGTLRLHPPPLETGLAQLVELAESVGVTIDASSSFALQKSLDAFTRSGSDASTTSDDLDLKLQAITSLLTSPMQPAEYFCCSAKQPVEWRHFALNIPYYTHFTSPIRRYADVMVHRLLLATLQGEEQVDAFDYDEERVEKICTTCNERKGASKKAQERSDRVFLCLYLKANPVAEVLAVVVGMGDKSFTVLVPDLGLEGRVYLDDTLDHFDFKGGEEESKLHGTKCISVVPKAQRSWSVLKIKMFVKISVQVTCKDEPPVDVKLKLNGPWTN